MEKLKLNIQMFASNGCTVTVVSCTPSSASDNYSTIKIHGKLTTGSSSYNYGGAYMQPTISNQPVVGSQTASQTLSKKKYNIGTNGTKEDDWTFTVYHNDDGTCNNLTIKIKWYISDSTNGTTTLSGGYTPATIARASSVTATDGTLNSSNSVSITITRKNNTFTHTLRYVCGNASGWIKDSNNKVATSATWTPPLSLANQNQSGNSVSCRIYCQTYDGNNTVGSEVYKDITLTIPTMNPTASISTPTDNNSFLNTYGVFLQNKSRVKATLSGTAQYTTIKSYHWEVRVTNSTGQLLASGDNTNIDYSPTSSGTLYISGKVTDKREKTHTTSTTVSITAYNTPKCNLSVSRTGDTTASYTMSGSGSPLSVTGKTQNVVRYLLKRDSTTIRDTNSGTSYSSTDSGISANSSYTYTLTASDTISGTTDTKTVTINTTFTLMNFNSTGYGMAIGKASEATGTNKLLEIALPTTVSEDITTTKDLITTKLNGTTWDFDTNNTANTWVPVQGGGKWQHRVIPVAYNSAPSTLSVKRASYGNTLEAVDGRITNANITHYYDNSTAHLKLLIASSAMTSNKPKADGYILACNWDNSGEYVGQLYLPNKNDNTPIQFRGCLAGTWGSWEDVYRCKSLYDNSSGTTGTVTLSETSANFEYLEIFYSYYAGSMDMYNSVKIYSPNGKIAMLIGSYDNGTRLYHEVARYTISGTSITRSNATRWRFGTGGENSTRTNTTSSDPSIKVVKVIGYR